MILSNEDLKLYLKKGIIKIEPLSQDQIGSATIDLTLGNEFWFFKKKYLTDEPVDLSKVPFQEATQKSVLPSVTLESGAMCLGITKEKITLPATIMGRLEGRSRFARMGLAVHITSAVVQPGVSNHQVLEIVNYAPFPVTIHAGMRISQVVFYELKNPSTKPYVKFGSVAKHQ